MTEDEVKKLLPVITHQILEISKQGRIPDTPEGAQLFLLALAMSTGAFIATIAKEGKAEAVGRDFTRNMRQIIKARGKPKPENLQ